MRGSGHMQGAAHVSPSCSGSSSPVLEPLPSASATSFPVTVLSWSCGSSSLLGTERTGWVLSHMAVAVPAGAMAAQPPSTVTSGCWASAGPPLAPGHLLGLLGSQGWHLAGHRGWEHQWGHRALVAPSLGTQLLTVPTQHVLTRSCLGMTAMLTLRRADPCNRGAGGEQLLTHLLCSCFSLPPSPSPPQHRQGTPWDTANSCWR